jgi:AcrR family transcriptional regulator
MVGLAGESGYAATTVAEVIERAEVSRKTFYAHFADRDALLLTAFDATAPVALAEVRDGSRRTGRPTRQIEVLMQRLCRVARENPSTIALSTIGIAAVEPGRSGASRAADGRLRGDARERRLDQSAEEMAELREDHGLTFREIGERYGIKRQRVHQILKARDRPARSGP